MDLIITHKSCPDGFVAAYVAKKRYPEAEVMFRDYNMEPPYEQVTGRDVLVTDFSWRTREENDKLASLTKSFRMLDHHKSAREIIGDAPYATFDMNRSGAGLAWDYLFGRDSDYRIDTANIMEVGRCFPNLYLPRPWYVNYVEDRDLWRHVLPNSRAVNAFLASIQFDFDVWDKMVRPLTEQQAMGYGIGALRYIESYVRVTMNYVQSGKLFFIDAEGYVHEYKVSVANASYMTNSDLLDAMVQDPAVDIGISWFERADGKAHLSLCTAKPDVDVSKIAVSHGGGGHRTKAGIQLPINEARILIDSILGRWELLSEKDRIFFEPIRNA